MVEAVSYVIGDKTEIIQITVNKIISTSKVATHSCARVENSIFKDVKNFARKIIYILYYAWHRGALQLF